MHNQSRFFDLSNQTAVIAGATGIGQAIATRLALAGATVALADINERMSAETASGIGKAFPLKIDVTNCGSVEKGFHTVIEQTGRLDILVNDAGVAGRAAPCGNKRMRTGSVVSVRRRPS